ncbi:hypothetical protein J7355_13145 [Endozoicomonas sp. G2_2]|uniref:hypothetical protein n=1 Tax=Endozoicomonas sp. G2_2 TaxID=2821092 RepID=UPI001ADC47D4|nr:hypothetical protein [Endozoicomonas sp. G2_2]MBO9471040.1 hypothetical protein [Endozoicomonas sp. G2_2]
MWLSDAMGRSLNYTGDYQHDDAYETFQINQITSVIYENPVLPEDSFKYLILNDGATQVLILATGERLEVTDIGDDYSVTLTTRREDNGSFDTLTTTLSTLEDEASESTNAGAQLRYQASGRKQGSMMAGFQKAAGAEMKVLSQVNPNGPQQVSTTVQGACGPIESGLVTNQTTLGTPSGQGIVTSLFEDARATVTVPFDSTRQAFYAEFPISVFPTALEASAILVSQTSVGVLTDKITGKISSKTQIQRRALIALRKRSGPAASRTRQVAGRMIEAINQINSFQTIKDQIIGGVNKLKNLGQSIGILAAGSASGNLAPARISSTFTAYSDGAQVSDYELVDFPGVSLLEFELRPDGESVTPMLSGDIEISPASPGPGESYRLTLSTTCDSAPTFSVRIQVAGTDGYSDSETIPLMENASLSIQVPGAGNQVRDTITISVLDGDDQVVDQTTAIVVFGSSSQ